MMQDWNFLPNLITAASSLGGAGLGAWLTARRETAREKARQTKEETYLAILVGAHLEKFSMDCTEVAFDDGTERGQPVGKDGSYQATTDAPIFDPLSLDVNWKTLPPGLMYEILNLPYKAEQLARRVSAAWEYDDPPDYCDYFWERQRGYAELGLSVIELSRRLRSRAGLAKKEDRDQEDSLRAIVEKVGKERSAFYIGNFLPPPDLPLPTPQ